LGWLFLFCQYYEYLEASFDLSSGIYGRVFFITTGFHGLHVCLGSLILLYCLINLINGYYTFNSHLSLELSAWYWHFVDVVWLFLYLFIIHEEIVYKLSKLITRVPIPKNLSLNWNWGSLLAIFLATQFVTGLLLASRLSFSSTLSFEALINVIQDTSYGWLIRLLHARGASWYFLIIYLHIGRGIYYKSFILKKVWFIGAFIYLLSIAAAFIGYVLPLGQISFWAATVITKLLSILPYIGEILVNWIWGGFGVGNPTITRFFTLHYLLPFIILVLVFTHLIFLHQYTSTNPLGVDAEIKLSFHYAYIVKDLYIFVLIFYIFFIFTLFFGYSFIDPENWIPANPLITPKHIQPEWYFLFAYAILRAIPNKTLGVLALLTATCGVLLILLVKSPKKK